MKSVLFIGSSYYNIFYLSRSLRELGWKADLLSYGAEGNEQFSHGGDFHVSDDDWPKRYAPFSSLLIAGILKRLATQPSIEPQNSDSVKPVCSKKPVVLGLCRFIAKMELALLKSTTLVKLARRMTMQINKAFPNGIPLSRSLHRSLGRRDNLKALFEICVHAACPTPTEAQRALIRVLDSYSILHFAGVWNLRFMYFLNPATIGNMPIEWDIATLKRMGMIIVYSNTGCLDGVSQTSFSQWEGEGPVCDICRWQHEPTVCSDERNLRWGNLRNRLCDYQVTHGANRADCNLDPRIHEVPGFYAVDTEVWRPDLDVPPEYRLNIPSDKIKLYHAVGNYKLRTHGEGINRNIKCTHIYLPLFDQLKREGYPVEHIFCTDVPNNVVRYYQAQADIIVDMLTFGYFGANGREAMMLGKPFVCYLRPIWLEQIRAELPEFVEELPIVSATPDTIHDVLVDLITNPDKRQEIGQRSRAFAVKWYSKESGARQIDRVYRELMDAQTASASDMAAVTTSPQTRPCAF